MNTEGKLACRLTGKKICSALKFTTAFVDIWIVFVFWLILIAPIQFVLARVCVSQMSTRKMMSKMLTWPIVIIDTDRRTRILESKSESRWKIRNNTNMYFCVALSFSLSLSVSLFLFLHLPFQLMLYFLWEASKVKSRNIASSLWWEFGQKCTQQWKHYHILCIILCCHWIFVPLPILALFLVGVAVNRWL